MQIPNCFQLREGREEMHFLFLWNDISACSLSVISGLPHPPSSTILLLMDSGFHDTIGRATHQMPLVFKQQLKWKKWQAGKMSCKASTADSWERQRRDNTTTSTSTTNNMPFWTFFLDLVRLHRMCLHDCQWMTITFGWVGHFGFVWPPLGS